MKLHYGEFVPTSGFKLRYRVLKLVCYTPMFAHSRSLHQSTCIAAAVAPLAAPMIKGPQVHSVATATAQLLSLSGQCSICCEMACQILQTAQSID